MRPMDYGALINPAVAAIPPSGIRRFFDLTATMGDVVSLTIGEPDFSTPWHIRQAAIDTLEKGKTWYTANAGQLALREAISGYLDRRFQTHYDPASEIVVTVGGSEAIDRPADAGDARRRGADSDAELCMLRSADAALRRRAGGH